MHKKSFPLGQLLVEKGVITPEQLEIALKRQKETGELLGVALLGLNFVDEEAVFLPVVAGQFGVDFLNLKDVEISKETIAMIPPKFVTHYKVIPVNFKDNILTIAMTTPTDVHTLDALGLVVSVKLNPVLASERDILEAIRKYYGVGAETIDQMMGSVHPVSRLEKEISDIDEEGSDASISKFLNQILLEAYKDKATDIHFEPFEKDFQIRYRVDGILYDAKVPPNIKLFQDAIISRIKILADLNIAEKRLPQDGRFKVRVGIIDLDLRVSTLPTPFGESVVLRVLNTTRLFTLEELGLPKREKDVLKRLIQKPHGIIFLTGPTGSGKTTTLYSSLSSINREDKKIITVEDPIEYQLKGITQVQVNPLIGLTFAQGLRSMLRHDPDVMMVGEVRDIETAEIAIQVALTGHLIFSTLHTNDAVGGVARLLDMGVDPYLITSTVECFIAQRLVRMLCSKCKQPVELTVEMMKDLGITKDDYSDGVIYEAKGCDKCRLTGYSGRAAIYEFLVLNEKMRQLVLERASADKIKEAAISFGMTTLQQAGWNKVKEGLTSPQEIIRVTQEE